MSERIDKAQLISRVAKRLSKSPAEIEPVADALLEEIYEALNVRKVSHCATLVRFTSMCVTRVPYSSSIQPNVSERCLAGRLPTKASCEAHLATDRFAARLVVVPGIASEINARLHPQQSAVK